MECETRTLCSGCLLRRTNEITLKSADPSESVRGHANEAGVHKGIGVSIGRVDHEKRPAVSVSCEDIPSSVCACLFCGETPFPGWEFPALYPVVSPHKAIAYVRRKMAGPSPIIWEHICKGKVLFFYIQPVKSRCCGEGFFFGSSWMTPVNINIYCILIPTGLRKRFRF